MPARKRQTKVDDPPVAPKVPLPETMKSSHGGWSAAEDDDAHEDETVAPPEDPTQAVDAAVDTGSAWACDNHPDRPATFVTGFPWIEQQHFCDDCTPKHYLDAV